MHDAFSFHGKTVLITGAGSGIGRALAVAVARRGGRLALVDVDPRALAETQGRVAAASPGTAISSDGMDVADPAAVAALPLAVLAAHGRLDVLVNNAGVALGGTFEEIAPEDFDWLFAINFGAVVALTRACLPLLRRSPSGWIVNISSLFGLIAPPGQSAYVASKFAVRGFSESLRHELAGSIGVTTVFPGGVATAIAASARLPRGLDPAEGDRARHAFASMLKLSPDVAATRIVRAIERRRAQVLIGSDARAAALFVRLFPVTYWRVLARLARRKALADGVAS